MICIAAQGKQVTADGLLDSALLMKDWHQIWLAFAIYSLIIAIAFAVLFKHEHHPLDVENASH